MAPLTPALSQRERDGDGRMTRNTMIRREHPTQKGEMIPVAQMDYAAAHALQWQLHAERVAALRPDTLVVLEHDPVMTLGRTTQPAHWTRQQLTLTQQGIPVIKCERGGSVTFHGPGQVVGYPILLLRNFCSGPKAYVHMLEEVVIRVLAQWNIDGLRLPHLPGVWVNDSRLNGKIPAKIAAVGVHVARGVTLHGFALNVTVNLEPFGLVQPCGLAHGYVTSMAAVLGICQVSTVREQIARCFGEVFGVVWESHATLRQEGISPGFLRAQE